VVIPLERLADYSRGIERINIEQSIRNKDAIMAAVLEYLAGDSPEARGARGGRVRGLGRGRAILPPSATRPARRCRPAQRWQTILAGWTSPPRTSRSGC
jgi:FAD/FMN-containing dehydrogenase